MKISLEYDNSYPVSTSDSGVGVIPTFIRNHSNIPLSALLITYCNAKHLPNLRHMNENSRLVLPTKDDYLLGSMVKW
jgi:hypothetical protein